MITKFVLSLGNFVAADGDGGGGDNTMWIVFALAAVLIIVMFVVGPITRRKKQTQYVDNLHKGMQVGATVKTLGGLIGKIVSINETENNAKEVVLETGIEPTKSTMTFDMMYIYAIVTNPDGSKYIPPNARPIANKSTTSTVAVKVENDNTSSSMEPLVETTGQEPDMLTNDTTSSQALVSETQDSQ